MENRLAELAEKDYDCLNFWQFECILIDSYGL